MKKPKRIIATETVEATPGPPCRSAEQMEQLCCEPVGELQCCEQVVDPNWQGYSVDDVLEHLGITLDENGRDDQGRLIEIRFKARENPCGTLVHRYKFEQKDCCDGVAPLEYDTDGSAGILAPGTSGIVSFTGGRLPALVKVRGNGFSLDGYNTREAWAYSRAFRVYAHDFACGTCPITINDGCSVTQGSLMATDGQWTGICCAWYIKDRYYTNYRGNYEIIDGYGNCGIPNLVSVINGANRYCTTFTGGLYYWSGTAWLLYWNISSHYIPISDFDEFYDRLAAQGWPEDTRPDVYAPNGPTDVVAQGLPLCYPEGGLCQWSC